MTWKLNNSVTQMDNKEIQKKYYEQTVSDYDIAHAGEHSAINIAVQYILFWAAMYDYSSFLDVGCGTGRAIKSFLVANPDVAIQGVEPVEAMVRQAIEKNGIPEGLISVGNGDVLEFHDGTFDAVCEFAVLHHVKQPDAIVSEMKRVARKAIFLVDSNRFGQGSLLSRYTKLILYKVGLWKIFNYMRTGGKGYMISEGDGLFYSYSVYDSYRQLAQWADRIILIPLDNPRVQHGEQHGMLPEWCNPLLTSSSVLLCAFRDV